MMNLTELRENIDNVLSELIVYAVMKNCPKCGGKCWSNEEDGPVCVYCGYIDSKPIPECIKKEAKQSRNGRPDNCR
jgi:hypothetical protein